MSSENRALAGVLWMLVTGLLFVAVTAIVKHIGSGIPAPEAAFLRYALGLVFLVPMVRPIMTARLTGRQLMLFSLRGVVHTLAVMLWFFSMTRISIAEVTAMNYLSPIYVTLGAAFFLGEKIALRRILAVAAALVGALIILRPGFREISPGHIAMLATAVFFAAGYLVAKQMADEVSPSVVVGMLSITVTIGLAPFAWAVWVTPTMTQVLWFLLLAAVATLGHLTMTFAFRAAPITVTQPVTFLQLFWATLLGYFVFGEPLDFWVILGGGVIIASVSFITWREAVRRREVLTPPHVATKV